MPFMHAWKVASLFVKNLSSSCMEGLEFILVPLCIFLWISFLFFGDFWSPFWWIFVGRFLRCFFVGFVLGVRHEVDVPLFLVILPLKSRGKLSNLVVFCGAQVLEVEPRDLQFPMIESISVEFL
jgi:hypothetical protein